MAAGCGRALCCRVAGLWSGPERGEDGDVRAREGRWRRGGGFETQRGRDGEGPWGRRPQGELDKADRKRNVQLDLDTYLQFQAFIQDAF